jgi:glycopeptide antibiotics resistance protein
VVTGVWELEAGIGVLLFLLVLPVVSFPMLRGAYTRYGRLPAVPTITGLGALLYGVGLVAFTLFPIPADSAAACEGGDRAWRWSPLQSFGDSLDVISAEGVVPFLTSGTFLQVVMNVVFFLPLGALLGWRTRRPLWSAALLGLGASMAIELTQGTGVWGLYDCAYRLADAQDLLTNTTGAVLGWFAGRHLLGRVPWPDRVPVAGFRDPGNDVPTVGRRLVAVLTDVVAIVLVGIALQIAAGTVARWFDAEAAPADWPVIALVLLGTVVPIVIVALAMPMARADRAGPGEWSTLLAVRSTGRRDAPPAAGMAARAAVRWTPLVLLSFGAAWSLGVFVLATLVQLAAVWRSPGHVSLAGRASGTETRIAGRREVRAGR